MQTKIKQANISAPIVINNAEAQVNATLATNLAQMESYLKVTKTEAKAYGSMKTSLNFKTDRELLDYIKVKTINSFNPKNMIIGLSN
mmetsp:Transcript_32959/g.50418  ORF Transcript_32959/g.50418 Transcript_32959/m.50418 type:complete len:87 (+) Transcript_32959:651-911(+)